MGVDGAPPATRCRSRRASGVTPRRHALGLDPGGRYIGMIGDRRPQGRAGDALAAFGLQAWLLDDRLLLSGRLAPG